MKPTRRSFLGSLALLPAVLKLWAMPPLFEFEVGDIIAFPLPVEKSILRELTVLEVGKGYLVGRYSGKNKHP